MSVYISCPVFENENFLFRMVQRDDCAELLKVYSDEKALPLFNSDNCRDDFHYTTAERMMQAIDFWLTEYSYHYYVRWSVISKSENAAVGTIELFNRSSEDFFNNCGLLRLDLRSDYERKAIITEILGVIIEPAFSLFECGMLATKAIPQATERISSLKELGFSPSDEKVIGHDGTEYGNYFVRMRL